MTAAPEPDRPSAPSVAVVGAAGEVGRTVLRLLEQTEDDWGEIRPVDHKPMGARVTVRGEPVAVQHLRPETLAGSDIILLDVPDQFGREWADAGTGQGAVVLSSTDLGGSAPTVVPHINGHLHEPSSRREWACPSPVTLAVIDALDALDRQFGVREVVMTTLEAVTGSGRAGVERLTAESATIVGHPEIGRQTSNVRYLLDDELPTSSVFPGPIALNVLPVVGVPGPQGWTALEERVARELREVLAAPALPVSVTRVQVPVLVGHAVSLHVKLDKPARVDQALQTLVARPEVVVLTGPGEDWPTPVDVAGSDPVFVGRVRQQPGRTETLEMFVCADNLRAPARTLLSLARWVGGAGPRPADSVAGGDTLDDALGDD